jgi:SSS family solute:Na+ symporter
MNTITPQLFHTIFPGWCAGIGYAAVAIGALIPAAVMSISAANLFTRSIYREYLHKTASPATEARVSRYTSLVVKFGAVAFIFLLNPQFSVEFQLIGGVLVLQTIPAFCFGLWIGWFHRWALIAGLLGGLFTGVALMYQIPQLSPNGRTVLKAHFGGSSWPLAHLGLHTSATVYVGVLALLVNVAIVVLGTPILHAFDLPAGADATRSDDYFADTDDPAVRRLDGLVDGLPPAPVGAHAR